MKRLIKFWGNYSDKCEWSNCSTRYEVLPILVDDADGDKELLEIALSNNIKYEALEKVESKSWAYRYDIQLTHALRLTEKTKQDSGVYLPNKIEPRVTWLGFVTLPKSTVLEPKDTLNNKLTVLQCCDIVNLQECDIDDVADINGEVTLIRQGWDSYHGIALLGYSMDSFLKHYKIEHATFSDEVAHCHECGQYVYETNGYQNNFVVVEECNLLGKPCGCYDMWVTQNIKIREAKPGDAGKAGIHLLEPTDYELEDAISRAGSNLPVTIYTHTQDTFAKHELKAARGGK